MRYISNNIRRATQDLDLDFIRYPLEENSIRDFIKRLNSVGDVSIKIINPIQELKQQDYHGKRVYIEIIDNDNTTLKTKIDLGVHKQINIVQEEFCFDLGTDDEGVCLLINSKEQMLTEKLRSILKFDSFSTRYKDVFDICYLIDFVDKTNLSKCFKYYIYDDNGMKENNINDIIKRISKTFKDKAYLLKLQQSQKNWLDLDIHQVMEKIINFLIFL